MLDFGGVGFMDSSGIGLILGRYRLLQDTGGVLAVQGVSAQIAKMLRLSGIGSIITLEGERKRMKPINQTKITFPSRSSNEAFARGAVAAFVAQLDPTVDELADIKTAVSEAVTNCIVHAYPGAIGRVYITVSIFEDGRVRLRIADKGVGIEDVQAPCSRCRPPAAQSGPASGSR